MNIVRDCRYGKMMFNPEDVFIGASLDHYGEFSELEVELFRHFLKPGDLVIEAGANIGCHTVALSRIVGELGQVVAFEPERSVYYTLCGNLALNSLYYNTQAYHAALGNHLGTVAVPLLDYDNCPSIGTFSLDKQFDESSVQYNVLVMTLDSLKLPRCDFIKADVEGWEQKVLEGAQSLIQSYRPILYVENDREDKAMALKMFLRSLGYRVYYHFPRLYNPDNFYGFKTNIFNTIASSNLLAIPQERQLNDDEVARFRLELWEGQTVTLGRGALRV